MVRTHTVHQAKGQSTKFRSVNWLLVQCSVDHISVSLIYNHLRFEFPFALLHIIKTIQQQPVKYHAFIISIQ